MIIRTTIKKGIDHPVYCEDDLFFSGFCNTHNDYYYVGAIFDGCSTGIKSHFASSLFGKILSKSLNSKTYIMFNENEYSLEEIMEQTFIKFFNKLKEVEQVLSVNILEILSTFIFVIIKGNSAHVIVSGDGCILVDNDEHKLESFGNAPDYLSYHLDENVYDVYKKHIKKFKFDNIKAGLSICSDGIYSFRHPDTTKNCTDDIIENLLQDRFLIKSEAMLSRKYNMLLNSEYSNYDDLSIVRFIFND